MNVSILPKCQAGARAPARPRDRWARTILRQRLGGISWGRLTLRDDAGDMAFGRSVPDAPDVTVRLWSQRFYGAVVFGGSVGAAESYVAGQWDCDDLPALVRLLVGNRAVLERIDGWWSVAARPAKWLYHRLRRNTAGGARANIAAHYDLGNEFYRLFLDETMTYSSAVFTGPACSLADAQREKVDRLCDKLDLSAGDHLLEIGTGWGHLAVRAAERYGCKVTTTTLSREQAAHARAMVASRGLADRVTVLEQDYRELTGTFDKLISVEMIEAVGREYLGEYLRRCAQRVRPDGAITLQAITIADQQYERHVRTVDFIKRYIFPGSCLPSVSALCQTATAETDLRMVDLEDITPHYARTLRLWRERFNAHRAEVSELGLDMAFQRLWEFYLAYCEGAFAERYIGSVQMVFARPGWRGEVRR
jgi:cyclopropane-fatty-acyl-phospholipid synthase